MQAEPFFFHFFFDDESVSAAFIGSDVEILPHFFPFIPFCLSQVNTGSLSCFHAIKSGRHVVFTLEIQMTEITV